LAFLYSFFFATEGTEGHREKKRKDLEELKARLSCFVMFSLQLLFGFLVFFTSVAFALHAAVVSHVF